MTPTSTLSTALADGWRAARALRPRAPRLGTPEYAAYARRYGRVAIRPVVLHPAPAVTLLRWSIEYPLPDGAPVWGPRHEDTLARAIDVVELNRHPLQGLRGPRADRTRP